MSNNPINLGDEANAKQVVAGLRFALAEAQRDVLELALSHSEAIVQSRSRGERTRLLKEVMDATGCKRETATKVLSVLSGLAGVTAAATAAGVDRLDALMLSAIQEGLAAEGAELSEREQTALRHVVEQLTADRSSLQQAATTSQVIRGWLPMFESFDATTELRSNRPPFASEEDLPKVRLELVPIASIRLTLDSGDPGEVCFQATDADLEMLANRINRLRAELAHLGKVAHTQDLP